MPISQIVKHEFSKARLLNNKERSLTVTLSASEIYGILLLICQDLQMDPERIGLPSPLIPTPESSYFKLPAQWYLSHGNAPSIVKLQEALSDAVAEEQDIILYFANLCSLHKRRLKFQMILSAQAKPTMDQIGAKALLEYGRIENEALFNWLIWRKWLFDIDNRSAQETGYLFEPILASSLGGEARSATTSPVKRIDENGEQTNKGRQIDCYIGDENLAYEFKLRLTIAASGQGRWGEEMSFPKECQAASLKPILIVLDPTHSTRLRELSETFLRYGGEVYLGEDAWQHLKDRAGPIMARFVERYIKPALDAASEFETTTTAPLSMQWSDREILVRVGESEFSIPRNIGEEFSSDTLL